MAKITRAENRKHQGRESYSDSHCFGEHGPDRVYILMWYASQDVLYYTARCVPARASRAKKDPH